MPAHSGPVARTAAATLSPKLSAIVPSIVADRAPARLGAQRLYARCTMPAPPGQLPEHLPGRARVPEGGRAHLDRVGAGHGAARPRRAPVRTPPTPTMGVAERAARHSHTARTATGWTAAPERPPPPAPRTGRPVSDVDRQPEQGVDERQRRRPRPRGRRPRSRPRRARWGSAWPTAAARTPWPPARRDVASAEWANMRERSSTLGQLTFTSSATITTPGRHRHGTRHQLGGTAKSSTVRPQMLTTTRAPEAARRGQVVGRPRRQPRALQPDAVEHPGADLVHPRWRVARPRVDGQRLDHDGAQVAQVAVGGRAPSPWPDVPDAVSTGLGSATSPTRVASTPAGRAGARARSRVQVLERPHVECDRTGVGDARGGRPRRGHRGEARHLVAHAAVRMCGPSARGPRPRGCSPPAGPCPRR